MSRRLSDIPEDGPAQHEPAQHGPANEHAAPRPYRKSEERRDYEFGEFLHADYAWFIKTVERTDAETIEVTLQDGRKAVVKRSLNWLAAPIVWLNGQRIVGYDAEFRPALTSVRWLMMLAIA